MSIDPGGTDLLPLPLWPSYRPYRSYRRVFIPSGVNHSE